MSYYGIPVARRAWREGNTTVSCPYCGRPHEHNISKDDEDVPKNAACGEGYYTFKPGARIDLGAGCRGGTPPPVILCDHCDDGRAVVIADGDVRGLCEKCADTRIANFNALLASKGAYRPADEDVLCPDRFIEIAVLRDEPLEVLSSYSGASWLFDWLGEAGVEAVRMFVEEDAPPR